jgi:hypothetical protein
MLGYVKNAVCHHQIDSEIKAKAAAEIPGRNNKKF